MKKLLLLATFVIGALLTPLSWASCNTSTLVTTPDFASVSACVASAARNSTVTVSAGSATWSSTLNLTKGIALTGAGAGSTIITSSGGITFIDGNPDATAIANNEVIRITGFTFDGNNSSTIFLDLDGASGISGTKPFCCYAIGNNTFKNQVAGTSNGVITAADANGNGQLRGVIYSNTFDRTDITMRVFSNNDTREWANTAFNNLAFGTSDNLFFESNTIQCSSSYAGGDSGWSEVGQGGRLVMRYNTYNMANCGTTSEFNDIHGFQNWNGTVNSGQTGSMIDERYGNTYTNVTQFRAENMRGGIDLMFDNVFTGSSNPSIDIYGQTGGASCPSNINPTPTNYNPLVQLAYFFNNTVNGTNKTASLAYVGTLGCTVAENNGAALGTLGTSSQGGWWNQNASCTASACSAGIGQGTTAPTGTCTKGTAYWVASTPGITTNPSVIQNASLYQCTATNTWTNFYTPYTFPHPLTGSLTVATPTASPVAGTYIGPQTITLSTTTTGATIGYTTDGSTPTANGAGTITHGITYTGPFTVSLGTTTVKAIGSLSGDSDSGVFSGTYIITPTTWFIRTDGGTRFSGNVPTGQCNGKFDLPYPGSGVNQNCAFSDFRFLWDDFSGAVGAGAWVIAGGDTVVIRGCTAGPNQVNPSNPNCRLGWDGPTGTFATNPVCFGVGNQDCISPPIPAGTAGQHTRILGACAYGTYTCTPIDRAHYPYTSSNLAQLFAGFGLTRGSFNLKSTSYVDIEGIELTTHNQVTSGNPGFPGNCTLGGSPAFPVSCQNGTQPYDDYSQNGFVTDTFTSNVTLQDVYIHGFNAAGIWGPLGTGTFTMTRVFSGFNGFAGWNFADQSDSPNASGAGINANYVTMNGNGYYEEYPIVHTQFPARAGYDSNSGGFGDAWSGQDTSLDTFICNHCVMENNTKDAFIGPHAQVGTLTVTNSYSAGNMGAQMKYGSELNANVLFQNNVFVMNCFRQIEILPGAKQSFAQSTGLGGSYLTNFCRAGGDGWSFLTRANSSNHFIGNTIIGANATMMDMNCGFVDTGGVHEETNCGTSPLIWTNNNILGFTDPILGQQPGLWFFDPGAGGSIVLTSSYNNEFGVRNISPDVCGTNHITCTDPSMVNEPAQIWPGSETSLDVFNPFTTGNSSYPTSGSPLRGTGITVSGFTTDYYGVTRPSPPTRGAIEPIGGSPTLTTITVTPNPGSIVLPGTLNMAAACLYSDGSTTPCVVTWTDTNAHSSVNSVTGVVTGVSAGSDTITATISTVFGTATVVMSNPPTTSITTIGATSTLGATSPI